MQKGLLLFIIPLVLLVSACDYDGVNSRTPLPLETWFPLKVGEKEIQSQIAIRAGEKERGLMFRETLQEDAGMLFVYKAPERMTYYMKNTPIPLDIGFFDGSGTLQEVHRMMPYDLNRTISNSDQIQFALEMNQGWFSRNQLYPGTKLDLVLVAEAISGRGEDPAGYGLSAKY